jgi:hypothetical protein
MHSERMSYPKWAKTAATVLSDKQLEFRQELEDGPLTPAHAKPVLEIEKMGETVGGTVSRKGKFGFTCESCSWVPAKGGLEDWVTTHTGRYVGLHFPHRCKRCSSRMKRWTTAARNYDQLEILRTLEGRHCLRFLTLTREEWNVTLPLQREDKACQYPTKSQQRCVDKQSSEQQQSDDYHENQETKTGSGTDNNTGPSYFWAEAEKLKKMATRQFRNWRNRNKYWQSREAKGQCYYEVTMKPVWNGWGFDEVQLHFHIHMVVCSKRIENKDIQIDLDTLEPIPMSTTIQREWGGIVDVRKCRTWEHKDGEIKTSKRFVMNYLVDYINKSAHWQSTKFGDWSN